MATSAQKLMIRKHLWIRGRVQGVYYRYSTQQMALQIGQLTGWVRNLRDGRVEVIVEGPESQVNQLVEWCHQGPTHARVDHIDIADEPCTGEFHSFEISSTA